MVADTVQLLEVLRRRHALYIRFHTAVVAASIADKRLLLCHPGSDLYGGMRRNRICSGAQRHVFFAAHDDAIFGR